MVEVGDMIRTIRKIDGVDLKAVPIGSIGEVVSFNTLHTVIRAKFLLVDGGFQTWNINSREYEVL